MPKKKEVVYEYVVVNDKTPIQKLNITDQIRVLLRELTYDPSHELEKDDVITKEVLTLKADLLQFLLSATEKIRKGKSSNVVVEIPSTYNPVLRETLESNRFIKYYDITIMRPKIDLDIEFMYTVILEVKRNKRKSH